MAELTIYAAGEIHSDWRDRLREELDSRGVDARIVGPQENHARAPTMSARRSSASSRGSATVT